MIERLSRYWFTPVPAERLASLRILVGAFALIYLVVRAPGMTGSVHFLPGQFAPVGPCAVLSQPLPPAVVYALYGLALPLGAAFVAGWRFRITGPAFAVLLLWVISYRNSWGMVFHTENLTVIGVLILGLAPAADAYAMDSPAAPVRDPDGRYGWAIRLMCFVLVIAYVIAGVTKVRNSGWDWATSDILRNYIAYDNLRKAELGDAYSWAGSTLVRYAWVFPPLAFFSLVMELGAPIALFGRRLAAAWALTAWAFHVGVLVMMWILFPYQLLGIAYAPFFAIERLRVLQWLGARFVRLGKRKAHHDVG